MNAMTDRTERLDSEIAKLWGEKVVNMYNQQDHQALYAIFNEQAKVKISYEQLKTHIPLFPIGKGIIDIEPAHPMG